jgi:hypothetical protein
MSIAAIPINHDVFKGITSKISKNASIKIVEHCIIEQLRETFVPQVEIKYWRICLTRTAAEGLECIRYSKCLN